MQQTRPDLALQRTRRERRGCHRRVASVLRSSTATEDGCAGWLSLEWLAAMKRIALIILVIVVTSGCDRWSDRRGWQGFQEDLEHRGLKGTVQVTPSSDEALARTITYTIAAGNQQTQLVTVM